MKINDIKLHNNILIKFQKDIDNIKNINNSNIGLSFLADFEFIINLYKCIFDKKIIIFISIGDLHIENLKKYISLIENENINCKFIIEEKVDGDINKPLPELKYVSDKIIEYVLKKLDHEQEKFFIKTGGINTTGINTGRININNIYLTIIILLLIFLLVHTVYNLNNENNLYNENNSYGGNNINLLR